MKRFLIIVSAALAFCLNAGAQTKAETKLYTKTMAKPSVKAYDKFLAKYPESTYALEVLTLRDTKLFEDLDHTDAAAVEAFAQAHISSPIYDQINALVEKLNTTDIDRAGALSIVKALASGATDAVAFRKTGVDHVYGISAGEKIELYSCLKNAEGEWTIEKTIPVEKYTLDAALATTALVGELELASINSKKYIAFNYLNSDKSSTNVEFVATVYDFREDALTNAMFYGKSMAGKNDLYKIEGQCPEALNTGAIMAESAFLLNRINADENLVPIAKADALADDAIAWWLEKNPTAQTKGNRLTFGTLDPECALIQGYQKTGSRDKINSSAYGAAMFNMRGYTVIVAYSKSAKNYMLVWAEPVCKNKKTDRLLNNIYFRDANTINMFYYKGNTTFDYDVNLSSKSIKR